MTLYAENFVRFRLVNDATYGSEATGCGSRVYPEIAPQRAEMPFAIVRVRPETPSHHLTNEAGVTDCRVEVSTYATDYDSARDLANAARLAVSNQRGTYTINSETIFIQSCRLENTRPEHLRDEGGEETGIFEMNQTYRVWYNTTNPS